LPRAGCSPAGYSSGYTSISLTTQSASVPVVETNSFGVTGPAMVTSSSSTSDWYTSTSGRVAAKRWSDTMYSCGTPVDG
jgi:hypothetical protein